ncbi:MAG: PEP-CTERM sorting domain-containing protein [Acidobacteriota bacterium]
MNRMLVCALVVLAISGIAGATPACTPGPLLVSGTTAIECGGLSFTNFNVVSAFPLTAPLVSYVSSDDANGTVNISFNPGLSSPTTPNGLLPQDLWFYFQVNGARITGVDLTVGGTLATVEETVCSAPTVNNICPEGTHLANIAAFSAPGQNTVSKFFDAPFGGALYVFKDVGVSQGGALSTFTQSFHTTGVVPEPASMLLIGTGLLALGYLSRRPRKL